jgi:hypothetical protein
MSLYLPYIFLTAGKYDADAQLFVAPKIIIAFQKVRGEEINFFPAIYAVT